MFFVRKDPENWIFFFFLELLLKLLDFDSLLLAICRDTFERICDNFANPDHISVSVMPCAISKDAFTGRVANTHLAFIFLVIFYESHDHVNRNLVIAILIGCYHVPIQNINLVLTPSGNSDYLLQEGSLALISHLTLRDRQT